jgi:geranylgeranyl transferase type-2 subunit alpha
MLGKNPEFYTVWNYRRSILLNSTFTQRYGCALLALEPNRRTFLPFSSPKDLNDALNDELSMTMSALKAHPKVYWIWNHRRWCLENIPEGGDDDDSQMWRKMCWKRELYLVEQMLDADARNCACRLRNR